MLLWSNVFVILSDPGRVRSQYRAFELCADYAHRTAGSARMTETLTLSKSSGSQACFEATLPHYSPECRSRAAFVYLFKAWESSFPRPIFSACLILRTTKLTYSRTTKTVQKHRILAFHLIEGSMDLLIDSWIAYVHSLNNVYAEGSSTSLLKNRHVQIQTRNR